MLVVEQDSEEKLIEELANLSTVTSQESANGSTEENTFFDLPQICDIIFHDLMKI